MGARLVPVACPKAGMSPFVLSATGRADIYDIACNHGFGLTDVTLTES